MKQPIKIANRKRRKKHKKRSAFLRSAGFFIKWSVVASIWCALVLGVAVIFFAHDLPGIDTALSEFRKPVITLLGANGKKYIKEGLPEKRFLKSSTSRGSTQCQLAPRPVD